MIGLLFVLAASLIVTFSILTFESSTGTTSGASSTTTQIANSVTTMKPVDVQPVRVINASQDNLSSCHVAGEAAGLYLRILSNSSSSLKNAQVESQPVLLVDNSRCYGATYLYQSNDSGIVAISASSASYFQIAFEVLGRIYNFKVDMRPEYVCVATFAISSGELSNVTYFVSY